MPLGIGFRLLLAALVLHAPACLLDPRPETDGAALFRRARCTDCHGEAGRGSTNGPALRDLERHWTEGELARFLADPEAWRVRDERLDALARRFRTRMTPFGHLSEAQRRRLARHLLAGPRP